MLGVRITGMGAVHRARDTRLEREVAVKALPDAVAFDRDRLARTRALSGTVDAQWLPVR